MIITHGAKKKKNTREMASLNKTFFAVKVDVVVCLSHGTDGCMFV